ncbi:unnamed protein product, partial [Closterium sp. NIES-53]
MRWTRSSPRGRDGGKCGKSGHGATDLQTQAFKRHAATNKHQLAIEHQKKMLAQAGKQPRIDAHPLAKDDETTRVIALLNSLHFTTQNHLPMETWVRLVRCRGKHLIIYVTYIRDGAVVTEFFALLTVDRADAASLVGLLLSHVNAVGIDLRRITGISTDGASVMVGSKNGLVARLRTRIPHLVSCHCIAHREALAAKDAAESLSEFGMVDSFIRWLSTYLGSSGPWHQRFLDLHEVFTQTNLELQGINDVRWLSRGDAVCRLLAVLPGVIVMVHELGNKPMYQMVTSYRFQFMLRFLADVLELLNVLSKTFQHRQ